MTDTNHLVLSRSMARVPVALAALGGVGAVYGLIADPERTWLNLLVDFFYVLSLGVSAIFFFATQRLSSARWSVALRRIPEAFMLTLPVSAALMVLLFVFGRHALYPWADPHGIHPEHAFGGKISYLDTGFVLARVLVILLVWIAFAWRIRRVSLAQDSDRERSYLDPDRSMNGHVRLNRLAGVFAPVFAFTFTASAYDWIISLEPEWFSTMFAVYVFAGAFVQGIAAITLTTVILKRRGFLGSEVGAEQLHDLGKMLFAFSTFWAYIWVCQYLLIWYGNIPEEVTYYLRRTGEHWLPLFLASLVINWIIPFFALLSVGAKRNLRVLGVVSVLMLVGHWLDLYILVMPSKWGEPRVGPIEVSLAVGCAALFYLLVVRGLSRAPLVPDNDPVLVAERASGGGEP